MVLEPVLLLVVLLLLTLVALVVQGMASVMQELLPTIRFKLVAFLSSKAHAAILLRLLHKLILMRYGMVWMSCTLFLSVH